MHLSRNMFTYPKIHTMHFYFVELYFAYFDSPLYLIFTPCSLTITPCDKRKCIFVSVLTLRSSYVHCVYQCQLILCKLLPGCDLAFFFCSE